MPVPQTQLHPVFVTAPMIEAECVTPAPTEQIVDDPIPPLIHVIETFKEGIERNEKQIAALPERIPSPTDASCKKRWSSSIKHCSLQRISWQLSCERCMRSEDVLNTTDGVRVCRCLVGGTQKDSSVV